jgi:hypothetical protein
MNGADARQGNGAGDLQAKGRPLEHGVHDIALRDTGHQQALRQHVGEVAQPGVGQNAAGFGQRDPSGRRGGLGAEAIR